MTLPRLLHGRTTAMAFPSSSTLQSCDVLKEPPLPVVCVRGPVAVVVSAVSVISASWQFGLACRHFGLYLLERWRPRGTLQNPGDDEGRLPSCRRHQAPPLESCRGPVSENQP